MRRSAGIEVVGGGIMPTAYIVTTAE